MSQPNDLSRSLVALEQDKTLIAVIEMSQSNWLAAAIVPGVERQPLKKVDPDADVLLKLLHRWRGEAVQAGREIKRIAVAYEAGRDGFWLARWLRVHDIEAYVIHPSSVAVSREHRRAKTDRLDTELLMRAFLGWLRGEKRHCSMAAIPTIENEDARRPNRERESLVGERTRLVNRIKATLARFGLRTFKPTLRKAEEKLAGLRTAEQTSLPENTLAELRRSMARLRIVCEHIKQIEHERLRQLEATASVAKGPHAMVRLIARVIGVGHRDRGHAGERDPVARLARLQGGRALRGAHRLAGREWQEAAGKGSCQGGQRASAAGYDPAGVAIPNVPEGQRVGPMVPRANRERARRHA